MKKVHPSTRTQGSQLLGQRLGNVKENVGSSEGLERRPGFVTGQFQHGKFSAQLFPPKLDLAGVRMPLPMPCLCHTAKSAYCTAKSESVAAPPPVEGSV